MDILGIRPPHNDILPSNKRRKVVVRTIRRLSFAGLQDSTLRFRPLRRNAFRYDALVIFSARDDFVTSGKQLIMAESQTEVVIYIEFSHHIFRDRQGLLSVVLSS